MSVYKIVVLGNGGSGKSCLIIKMITGLFVDEYNPTIEDVHRKTIILEDETILMDIVDTAGQEEFTSISEFYVKEADGIVIVYAIDDKRSFEDVDRHFSLLRKLREQDFSEGRLPVILVGNKKDLIERREISFQEGDEYADRRNCLFCESSAKVGLDSTDIFTALSKEIRKQKLRSIEETTKRPRSSSVSSINKKGCVLF